jgi:hypothetical protein
MRVPGTNFSVGAAGLAAGAVAIVAAPFVLPVVANVFRTVLKTSVKTGMIAYDKSKELVTGTADSFGDIIDEARAEAGGKKTSKRKKAA